MNNFKLLFFVSTFVFLSPFGKTDTSPWSVEIGNDITTVSTTAVDGDFCRPEPSVLEVSCSGDTLSVSVESGCSPRPFSDGSIWILVTRVFHPGPNRLFDNSQVMTFTPDDNGTKYYLNELSVPNFIKDFIEFNTVSLGIADGFAAFNTPLPTSHFDVSNFVRAVKDSNMSCGIDKIIY